MDRRDVISMITDGECQVARKVLKMLTPLFDRASRETDSNSYKTFVQCCIKCSEKHHRTITTISQ